MKQKTPVESRIFGLRLNLEDVDAVRKMAAGAKMTISAFIRHRLGLQPHRRRNAASLPPMPKEPAPSSPDPTVEEPY